MTCQSSSLAADSRSTLLHLDTLSDAHLVRQEDRGVLRDCQPLQQPVTFYGVGQGVSHEIGLLPGLETTAYIAAQPLPLSVLGTQKLIADGYRVRLDSAGPSFLEKNNQYWSVQFDPLAACWQLPSTELTPTTARIANKLETCLKNALHAHHAAGHLAFHRLHEIGENFKLNSRAFPAKMRFFEKQKSI